MFSATEENRARRYLLGSASEEEQQLVEEQLLRADGYAEHLLMIEDELIDDYVRGALEEDERKYFEQNVILTPQRRKKLAAAQALVRYAVIHPVEFGAKPDEITEQKALPSVSDEEPPNSLHRSWQPIGAAWWQPFLLRWKFIASAVIVVIGVLGFWTFRKPPAPGGGQAELREGLALLHQAFQKQRPLEGRITEFGYAQYPETRRAAAAPPTKQAFDYQRFDEAEILLRKLLRQTRTADVLQAVGQLYLAKNDFEKAREHFAEALKLAPSDARLRNDLGVVWLESAKSSRSSGDQQRATVAFNNCLDELNQAISLDPTLFEALFNRALCWQELGWLPQARSGWQEYLQKDATSPWAEEAQRHLDELKK